MASHRTIYVYEYGSLRVGEEYNGTTFRDTDFDLLCRYITAHPAPQLYTLLHRRVRFLNYVGIIKVGDLTIEVLPKTDKHEDDTAMWQSVLIRMLKISLDVEADTTTHADIQVKRHSVLETYLHLFITEVQQLLHHGLIKKYRQQVSNQKALKGKLLIHHHVTTNIVHAERFYVSHTVYDRDNVYNYLLEETLHCIISLDVSESTSQAAKSLLINFPECRPVKISEKLIQRLTYDRKTERYRKAIQLARIILLNYHPDVKGGSNNILAIMFDMNYLWENYVYWILRRAAKHSVEKVHVRAQQKQLFWKHPDNWRLRLIPDLVVEITKDGNSKKSFILDTKWKYKSDTSIEDVRQMYAYGRYFESENAFLVYPDKLINEHVKARKGYYYQPGTNNLFTSGCGLAFVDLLESKSLNLAIGAELISALLTLSQTEEATATIVKS